MTLRDFIGAICAATNRAQSALSNYRMDYLREHMILNETGVMEPKMINIKVGDEIVSVPQYTLCQSNDLNLNDVIVKGHCEIIDFEEPLDKRTDDAKIIVRPCGEGHKNCFEIQLKFSAVDDLESESLLVEKLNHEMGK